MDGLRLALIVAGIVIVGVVYFWTARRRRLDREAGEFDRFDAWSDEDLDPLAPSASNDEARRDGSAFDDWAGDPDSEALTQQNLRLSDIQDALKEGSTAQASANQGVTEPHLAKDASSASAAAAKGRSGQTDSGSAANRTAPPAEPSTVRDRAVSPAEGEAKMRPRAAIDGGEVIEDLEAIVDSLDVRAEPHIGPLDDIKLDARSSGPTVAQSATGDAVKGRELRQSPPASVDAHDKEHSQANRNDEESHASAELVVVLNVMARANHSFEGPLLKLALEGAGLKPGDMQLYHYRAETQADDRPPIFSALNAVKPGTLDVAEFDGMRTPGIALILRMPGLERPSESFELMLVAARRIASELGGQVCDDSRSTLTGQALNHLRERIAAVEFRSRKG